MLTRLPAPSTEMDGDCSANPDWCSWAKIYIPYCTGDMHSGTQTTRNPALGNFYSSGHLAIAGVVADLRTNTDMCAAPGGSSSAHRSPAAACSPTSVLVTGSSAGGIAALMHTDYFAESFPGAAVKGAPQCGFFYPGVTAVDDFAAGRPTPTAHLGFIAGWKPWLPTGCAVATNNDLSTCTNAHTLYPFLRAPLFIRENQFDSAKLANCGWDGADSGYLKRWGSWMRAQLAVIRQSKKDGYFSASCLEHGGNFGWASSPVINGVTMREAMANWCALLAFSLVPPASRACHDPRLDSCPRIFECARCVLHGAGSSTVAT